MTPRRRRQRQKRRRHNDDIHDKDVENQQPSPHPMPPIILPQAFLHAPNTFKPVSHIGVMNNASSTVLNFTNVVYSMRLCPKTQALSQTIFYLYISVHYPKTQALSLKSFYHYFSVHCPKLEQSLASQLVMIKTIHCNNNNNDRCISVDRLLTRRKRVVPYIGEMEEIPLRKEHKFLALRSQPHMYYHCPWDRSGNWELARPLKF